MQGRVLNEMSSLTKTKARDPAETRKMVTELTTRIRIAEEIIGEKISDTHAKSILLGFIDDVTRQKTTDYHGTETRYEKLRTEVLKFTNNMGGDEGASNERKGPTPMQVGQFGQPTTDQGFNQPGAAEHQHWSGGFGNAHEDEAAWALRTGGKGTGCFNCGGPHFARECPVKGKGKTGAKGIGNPTVRNPWSQKGKEKAILKVGQ